MKYILPIKPKGKARPKVTRRGTFMPADYVEYKRNLQILGRQAGLPSLEDARVLELEFFFKIPKSISKKEKERRLQEVFHTFKPDLDNITGAVMDALILKDETVGQMILSKKWSEDFEGVIINV